MFEFPVFYCRLVFQWNSTKGSVFDIFEFKGLIDDIFHFIKLNQIFSERWEKGENVGYQHFVLFP